MIFNQNWFLEIHCWRQKQRKVKQPQSIHYCEVQVVENTPRSRIGQGVSFSRRLFTKWTVSYLNYLTICYFCLYKHFFISGIIIQCPEWYKIRKDFLDMFIGAREVAWLKKDGDCTVNLVTISVQHCVRAFVWPRVCFYRLQANCVFIYF
jgi:hypothetical protein